jgi:hypothetical protein
LFAVVSGVPGVGPTGRRRQKKNNTDVWTGVHFQLSRLLLTGGADAGIVASGAKRCPVRLTARSRVAFALELARCNLDVALFLVVPRCLAVVPCRRLPMSAF